MSKLTFKQEAGIGDYTVYQDGRKLGEVKRRGDLRTPWWKPGGFKVRCRTRQEAAEFLAAAAGFEAL